jgi:hypothetical protein
MFLEFYILNEKRTAQQTIHMRMTDRNATNNEYYDDTSQPRNNEYAQG